MSEKLVLITTKPDANKVSKPYRDMVMDAFERLTDEKTRSDRREIQDLKSRIQIAGRKRL